MVGAAGSLNDKECIGGKALKWWNISGCRSEIPCGAVFSDAQTDGVLAFLTDQAAKTWSPIAVRSVDVIGIVVDCGMDLTVSQLYENRDSVSREVYYILPLSQEVGLYRFEFKVYSPSVSVGPGSREGECLKIMTVKTKEDQVKRVSSSATSDMRDTIGDYFQAYIGTVGPSQLVQVRLAMVAEIKDVWDGEETSWLVDIPNFIFPNYGFTPGFAPTEVDQAYWKNRQNQWFTANLEYPIKLLIRVFQCFACDFKLMSTPGGFGVRDSRGYRTTSELDTWYPYCIQAHCLKSDAIVGLKIKVSPTFDVSSCGRLIVEGGRSMALLSLFCDAEFAEEAEVIFILDQSGSMVGSPMKLAKTTLLEFLKALPASVRFNVLGFGTDYELFFKTSKVAAAENLDQARTFVENAGVTLGSSDVLKALEFVGTKFSNELIPKSVVILSDGCVEDMGKIRAVVQEELSEIRIFSVGVGGSDSGIRNLDLIATLGAGVSRVLTNEQDSVDCVKTLTPLLLQQPLKIRGVSFSAHIGNSLYVSFTPDMVQTEHNKTIIYAGSRHNIFIWFKQQEFPNAVRATVTLSGPSGLQTIEIIGRESPASGIGDVGARLILHRLACQRLSSSTQADILLLRGSNDKKGVSGENFPYLQELSSAMNLMSPFTCLAFYKNLKFDGDAWAEDSRYCEVGDTRGKETNATHPKSKRRSKISAPAVRELYGGDYSLSCIRELMLGRGVNLKSSSQLPDGSFDLDTDFCSSLKIDYSYLNYSRKKNVTKQSWATAIAYVILDNGLCEWLDSPLRLTEATNKASSWIGHHMSDEIEISSCIHSALKVLWSYFASESSLQTVRKRQSYAHFYS